MKTLPKEPLVVILQTVVGKFHKKRASFKTTIVVFQTEAIS